MSTTTTLEPAATRTEQQQIHHHLHDYSIQLTGDEETAGTLQTQQRSPSPEVITTDNNSTIVGPPPSENPPGWTDNYRQVPPHRPINTQLDREQRPWGSNGVESAFVFTMFQGVRLKSTLAWLWNTTGGRFDDMAFRAKIGGEM
ncbi:hypothetical protein B0T22DRAFT_226296 [Podospora appendiculata]|uniref:Uncharacterized protein n=1 Tax=Podospora appendiculata TaxID=314037 RepID=A0AAE0X5R4_9PEZI|nr:hypothetical protein B0T22DRAFT_226296 [Podospora appendiculata]